MYVAQELQRYLKKVSENEEGEKGGIVVHYIYIKHFRRCISDIGFEIKRYFGDASMNKP